MLFSSQVLTRSEVNHTLKPILRLISHIKTYKTQVEKTDDNTFLLRYQNQFTKHTINRN